MNYESRGVDRSGRACLVLIVGSGHSGSTILDMALGSGEGAFSLGEIAHLPREIDGDGFCACGMRIVECDFWTCMRSHFESENGKPVESYPHQHFILPEGFLEKSKIMKLYSMFRGVHGSKWAGDVRDFYGALKAASKADFLIDSQKNFYRAILLDKVLDDYDVKYVHLVRDGRGVCASYTKEFFSVQLPGSTEKVKHKSVSRLPVDVSARKWQRTNHIINVILKIFIKPENRYVLRYEDFCNDPDRAFAGVAAWLGMKGADRMRTFGQVEHHNVAGNPSRFNSTEIKSPSMSWQTSLSEEERALFEDIAGKVNRKFGYT